MINKQKIGLSLSGGGYRATIYHLGTFKKLKELNLLNKVDVISTNSGGSITGATYGLYEHDFETFERVIRNGVKQSVIKGVLTSWRILLTLFTFFASIVAVFYLLYTNHNWYALSLLIFVVVMMLLFQFQLLPISKLNERMYNRIFFKGKTLSALSSNIRFGINATNLETGRLFTFSNAYMGDSVYNYPDDEDKTKPIHFKAKKFPIARAVAASTAVPFVFTPVKIDKQFFSNPEDFNRVKPRLVDGGVYDNQGAHKLTQTKSAYGCNTVIISDAGNIMPFKNTYKNTLTLLIRTSDVFMNRIKNLQMVQYLYENHKTGKREIAYQSLGWNIEDSIKKFIDGVKEGTIMPHVLNHHNITEDDITSKNWKLIKQKLKLSIDYNSIIKDINTTEALEIARKVSTNLIPLKDNQIDALVKHASVLTEIQVKLYCVSLFK
ncbi:patatin-like phospholipase family protein [Lacinutrix sp. 5H-3-7-4]|uniref:patatin-like phospholipase family protein n=1 Tax=Lacinutrix sp. (strain 5H-3-7-4) TaxID=983544 RepID=UPI00020A343F|nr:patatin-like phospholipase family protein [Lacinutrix sp. 5H-3-7-4]AEH02608.1 Patatin [Lacinutrix sp. 5H-3-7-4]